VKNWLLTLKFSVLVWFGFEKDLSFDFRFTYHINPRITIILQAAVIRTYGSANSVQPIRTYVPTLLRYSPEGSNE